MRVDWMLSASHLRCWPTNAAQFLQHIGPLSAVKQLTGLFDVTVCVCGFRLPSGGRGTKAGILTRPVEVSPEHLIHLKAAVKARGHREVVQAQQTGLKVIPGVGVWAVVAPANRQELCREIQAGSARLHSCARACMQSECSITAPTAKESRQQQCTAQLHL
jgi:hypothetical protein